MRIVIASGKGGTGKTLISTNLTRLLSEQGHRTTYADADVEEPNGHLFLHPQINSKCRSSVWVPSLNGTECNGCGKCQEICAFNAILSVKGTVLVFNELCHSCGACLLACPDQVLVETRREIGTIYRGTTGNAAFISGRLDVGEARATPLINEVVCRSEHKGEIVITDAPPGTSCGAVAASRTAELLLLVTEPTPFGMHDLRLALGMGKVLGLRMAAVINRCDLGDGQVKEFLQGESIPILAEIPFDPDVAKAYSEGRLPLENCDEFRRRLVRLGETLISTIGDVR